MAKSLEMRRLGKAGPAVAALGLGCFAMSGPYGSADDVESIATIQAACDAGITMLDTGDFYGMGHNETLIAAAIKGRRDKVQIAVKFGAQRSPDGQYVGFDGRPASVKNYLSYSLRRLETDYIDLYQPSRVDPNVPIEDTIGTVADLVKAGYVRHAGLSEASAETVRRAHAVHPIAALQIEYSPISRGVESEILPTLRALGIGLVAYGVLSRGLLGGRIVADTTFAAGDVRARFPRFQPENLKANLARIDLLKSIGQDLGATPAQLAFAWTLAQGDDIVPLIGTRTRPHLAEALGALDLTLGPDDLKRIERAIHPQAIAGTRYPTAQMGLLDSERKTLG
jgi:aryl-alcohol dehydrogenase-like predicted oxidoreductase